MFKRLVCGIVLVLLLATSSAAAPLGVAIGALSSWWASASLIIKLGVMLAVNVGVGLLDQYRARKAAAKNANTQPRGVTLQVQMGDTLPRSYLLGTRPTAGTRNYFGSWGLVDKTPNALFVEERELSCLPSYAGPTGLRAVRIGNIDGTILWNEPHPDGRGYPVQEFRSDGNDYFWIKYRDGTQTTADPYLRAKFGDHPKYPYKASMIGRGCQAVIVTIRRHEEMFRSGIPEMLFLPERMRLYNICKDSTAGGSGPHRWGDPTTHEPSDNLAVMAYNVARGIYFDGRWVHGGRNFAAHRLPASSWMAAINEAERDMGAGRKQFVGGLEVRVDEKGLSVLEKLRLGCVGRFAEVGGSLKMLVGAPAAAVWTMTDETIVVTRDQDFNPFPSSKNAVNTIRAVYSDPTMGWRSKEAPERSSAALLARDGGEKLSLDLDLEAVSDFAQVQCVSATMIDEAGRWREHGYILPPAARSLEPNDVLSWSSERNDYTNKKFIVARMTRLPGCLWYVLVRELDPADYDPTPVLLPPVPVQTGPIAVPAQPMAGWSAVKDTVKGNNGAARRVAIRVSCEGEMDDIVAVHVVVRVKLTNQIVFDNAGAAPYPAPGTNGTYSWLLSGDWCLPATTYLVEGAFVPRSRRKTLFSLPIEVTTDDIRLGDADVFLPGMVGEIQNSLQGLHEWLGGGTRDLIDTARRNALLDIEADVGRYRQSQSIRREVGVISSEVAAKAALDLTAATGPGSALAQGLLDLGVVVAGKASSTALTLLQAQVNLQGNDVIATSNALTALNTTVGKFSASGQFRVTVEATPSGARSRIGLSAAADGVEANSAAAIFLEAVAGAKSLAVINADTFVVARGDAREPVFAVDGDVVRMILAHIGTIRSGRLLSLNEKVDFDLNAGRLIFKS